MGCDIHPIFQRRANGKWVDVPTKYEGNRHYFLFAWLADVRNGYGFAGTPTHDPIQPIVAPRGLPQDFDTRDQDIGDHSYSWLTADEILTAPLPSGVMKTGIVTLARFRKWDGKSQPQEWCDGIAGRGVVVANSDRLITPETTHVRIEWPAPTDEFAYFINEVRRLREEHGEVRMVFGFDS